MTNDHCSRITYELLLLFSFWVQLQQGGQRSGVERVWASASFHCGKSWSHSKTITTSPRQRVKRLPDEVQQSVSWGHDRPWTRMVTFFLWARPRVNDEHQHDANDDGDEGRPQVVGDGQDSEAAARLRVHGWEAGHKTGWQKQEMWTSLCFRLNHLESDYYKSCMCWFIVH